MNLTGLPAAYRAVYKYFAVAVLSVSVSLMVFANAQPQRLSPGSRPFTPTRIDWLTTRLQASLRDDSLQTGGFYLNITSSEPETIVIRVDYLPTVNREAMNISIDSTRQVIAVVAKVYGWEKWVKVREDVQLLKEDELKR